VVHGFEIHVTVELTILKAAKGDAGWEHGPRRMDTMITTIYTKESSGRVLTPD